jgi:predicted nuclease of predicted toxin-antitoxin system
MARLFIEMYFDEDVSHIAVRSLRNRGYRVLTTQETARNRATDAEQLAYAASQNLTLVTHNRVDFEQLAAKYFSEGLPHAGIIIAVRRPATEIVLRLLKVLDRFTADEMKNRVIYL